METNLKKQLLETLEEVAEENDLSLEDIDEALEEVSGEAWHKLFEKRGGGV